MSPSRIQSAAGITTPPFRSPAFPTVSVFPLSPRSALSRPGPRRQGSALPRSASWPGLVGGALALVVVRLAGG